MGENNKQSYGGKTSFLQENKWNKLDLILEGVCPSKIGIYCKYNTALVKKINYCKSNDKLLAVKAGSPQQQYSIWLFCFFPFVLSFLCIPLWLLESGTSLIKLCDYPDLFYSPFNSLFCFYPMILTWKSRSIWDTRYRYIHLVRGMMHCCIVIDIFKECCPCIFHKLLSFTNTGKQSRQVNL